MRPPDPLSVHLGRVDGARTQAFFPASDIRFTLGPGQMACLVGPRGCGKTAILNLLAGLEGRAAAGIAAGIQPPPHDLHIAYLHSQTVRSNAIGIADSAVLVLPPVAAAMPLARRLASATASGRRDAPALSRRDALVAALRTEPDLLLIDAPRRDIDPSSARLFREVLLAHWKPGLTSIVMVAGLDDALLVADRLLVLSPRPTRLLADMALDLPRPRSGIEPALTDLREDLLTSHPGLFPEDGHAL
ncbi:ATP-binding cassette domain-containing protein [Zavarzinia sp. CC-PAN008]|uniref:ATP-binding cassette domain-containing protein n=1 Tax=Zavarzinia sp. CC-PAN008 TaxID=3243332 RepID=UPI003F74619F